MVVHTAEYRIHPDTAAGAGLLVTGNLVQATDGVVPVDAAGVPA
jgi:hypothetical protein